MSRGKRSEGAMVGTVLGLVLLAARATFILTVPCFGGLLAVLSFFVIGGKYKKVWRCKACRIVIPRG